MTQVSQDVDAGPKYRAAREFSFRLRQNTIVYLEDRQYLEGFTALNNLLAAGTSHVLPNGKSLPAFTPFPQQLVLAATLVVHPQLTTRARSPEDLQASNEALRFLRNVNRIVGPVNADFATVFTFESQQNVLNMRRRRTAKRNADSASTSGDELPTKYDLNSPFARERSVFAQMKDFWHVVGWAFNCSIVWRKRWDRWKLWLAFVLDVLEDDFCLRLKQARNSNGAEALKDSIVLRYLDGTEQNTARRRIMRAILADGSDKSLFEFDEVWQDETKEKKVKEEKLDAPRKKINLDEDEWGDYDFDLDEDEVADKDIDDSGSEASVDNDDDEFGGTEAILLRQRFIKLLFEVGSKCPSQFTSLEHLFDVVTESIRPLPLPAFNSLIATSTLSAEYQCSLITNTLLPFLAVTPKDLDIFAISQEDLLEHFFPHTANANSIPENAKMSLLIQTLLLRMWDLNKLNPSDHNLRISLMKGVKARAAKATGDARTKAKGKNLTEQNAKQDLDLSAEAIALTIELLETEAGILVQDVTMGGAEEANSSSQLSSVNEDVDDTIME